MQMSQEQLRQLQTQELEILLRIDELCKKHQITYFLAEGTLLGAVRHKGFIPWDDDVDIMMMRSEYEKFLKIAPEGIGGDLFIQHASTTRPYWSPFIKVRLVREPLIFVQKHIAHLTSMNGPCVDIFPVDDVPKACSFGQDVQGLCIDYLRNFLSLKLSLYKPVNLKQRLFKLISLLVPERLIHWCLRRLFSLFDSPNNEFAVNLASYYHWQKQTVPKALYGEPVMWEFEGHLLPIPRGYHELLTRIYGDYLQLPPEEKRGIQHNYIPVSGMGVHDE